MAIINPTGAYIISAVRTPVGAFSGSLSKLTAVDLGAIALKGALEKANLPAESVEAIFLGNVVSANLGQNPARQVALNAGCDKNKVIATNINKVCASGMKALMLAAQEIKLGESDIVAVVGAESMSNIPYYSPTLRAGAKFGNQSVVDGIVKDGLEDAYNKQLMGYAAEKCAADHNITREQQDQFAISSYTKAIDAAGAGKFNDEIVGVPITTKRGGVSKTDLILKDEEIMKFDSQRLVSLRPAFPDKSGSGTVTAGNASSLSDGAAAIILVSGKQLSKLIEKSSPNSINAYYVAAAADAEQEPVDFTTTPAHAIRKALSKVEGIDFNPESSKVQEFVEYTELNEAFSVVGVANTQLLELDPERVNINGGAVALGHPLGCSGARIIVALCTILKQQNAKRGVAAVCNGGGGASAVVIEKV
ncbi:hypothetical protein BB561_000816 [Smittium simulii]|uniref:acetyl-CoA C-acetyltransferase n=1 Tax=Smittium simulii TaxID=133385 RepID=A0A2T9YXE2_9FUNG|nr:hypothetical protein BB561_000816 [Smittium simulii]